MEPNNLTALSVDHIGATISVQYGKTHLTGDLRGFTATVEPVEGVGSGAQQVMVYLNIGEASVKLPVRAELNILES